MGGLNLLTTCLVVASLAMGCGGHVHHIVRGETGWEPYYELGFTELVFKVGDHIWFSSEDSIVELQSRKEYLSCDVSNPIKMYPDKISLEKQGLRYFASGNPRECKNGLKLHVEVIGTTTTTASSLNGTAMVKATGPTPSTSPHHLTGFSFIGLFILLAALV